MQAGIEDAKGENYFDQISRHKTLHSSPAVHACKTAQAEKNSKAPVWGNGHVWKKRRHGLKEENPGKGGDHGAHQGSSGNGVYRQAKKRNKERGYYGSTADTVYSADNADSETEGHNGRR